MSRVCALHALKQPADAGVEALGQVFADAPGQAEGLRVGHGLVLGEVLLEVAVRRVLVAHDGRLGRDEAPGQKLAQLDQSCAAHVGPFLVELADRVRCLAKLDNDPHLPAIGVFATATSLRGAAAALKGGNRANVQEGRRPRRQGREAHSLF